MAKSIPEKDRRAQGVRGSGEGWSPEGKGEQEVRREAGGEQADIC